MPPYWPWVQAIRSYVREKDPDQLRSEMGAGAADIAEVVSDVKERLPDLKPPPALDSPEQARFRLFDSITAFLKSASLKQPLVLVLDDLHWADQPSLLLLQFVARELGNSRLLLIGTYRDVELNRQHPLAESLGELTRERLFQRVLLRGLSQQDVGRFIEVAAGVDPPAGLTEAVHTQTEGNPLFVTEVVRLLVQEGALSPDPSPSGRGETAGRGEGDSWTVRIPEGVREVIGRRLNRLSQRCNETLTIASVIGREFELRQLAPLVEDISEDRLLEVLEEALSARVIEELPQAVGRYQFTHALIQETLSEELTLTRRVRLHARIAETLEELYGDNADGHAAELAHHFAQAEAVTGSDRLVHYLLLAGERALVAYGWEEALSHFERGLSSRGVPLAGLEAAPDQEAAALLFGLARAQVAVLDRFEMETGVNNLRRAFDYYAEAGEVDQVVAVGGYPLSAAGARLVHEAGLIPRALALVPPDSHFAGNLLYRYGWELGRIEGNYDAAQSAFNRALSIADQENDRSLEMWTRANATYVNVHHLRYQVALENGPRAIELAQQLNEPMAEVLASYYTALSLIALGEFDEARQHASRTPAVSERLRDRAWLTSAIIPNQLLCQATGDFKTAIELTDQGLALSPMDRRHLQRRAHLEYETGNFSQGEIYLERLIETIPLLSPGPASAVESAAFIIPIVARISGVPHRLTVAQEAATTVLSTPSANPVTVRLVRCGLALLAVAQGDAAAAREQYAALESLPGTFTFTALTIDRVLGLLSHTMGNLDQATGHFEDALAFCRKAGFRPELAWICCDYAHTLLQRHSSTGSERTDVGDREKAMSLLDESLAISSELGMRPLMERVLSRRDILKA